MEMELEMEMGIEAGDGDADGVRRGDRCVYVPHASIWRIVLRRTLQYPRAYWEFWGKYINRSRVDMTASLILYKRFKLNLGSVYCMGC